MQDIKKFCPFLSTISLVLLYEKNEKLVPKFFKRKLSRMEYRFFCYIPSQQLIFLVFYYLFFFSKSSPVKHSSIAPPGFTIGHTLSF